MLFNKGDLAVFNVNESTNMLWHGAVIRIEEDDVDGSGYVSAVVPDGKTLREHGVKDWNDMLDFSTGCHMERIHIDRLDPYYQPIGTPDDTSELDSMFSEFS